MLPASPKKPNLTSHAFNMYSLVVGWLLSCSPENIRWIYQKLLGSEISKCQRFGTYFFEYKQLIYMNT